MLLDMLTHRISFSLFDSLEKFTLLEELIRLASSWSQSNISALDSSSSLSSKKLRFILECMPRSELCCPSSDVLLVGKLFVLNVWHVGNSLTDSFRRY